MSAISAPQQRPSRDTSAAEGLVTSNYGRLYRWFLWLTNSPADAADLTQDTFVALWESLERLRPGMPSAPWLYGIARNVWRNSRRRGRQHGGEELLEQLPHSDPEPEQTMLAHEAIELLERAVAELPPDYREAVVLRFWEDFGYEEIAAALSITEGLARWRVHQARKLLSDRLTKTGVVQEQAFRAGGKVGWWMRVHQRSGPPSNLLERCMATIPSATRTLPQIPAATPMDEFARPAAQDPTGDATGNVRVGTLDELRAANCLVVRHDGRNVAVFYDNGSVRAVENRCPHMGFPLHRGSVRDGILTCFWHHARFDLASGCTFDLWADDVPTYPAEVCDGEVWLLPRPPRDEAGHWRQRLREGMQHNLPLVTAKAVLGLMQHGADAKSVVRQAALFGACYRDDWADGLTILAANANLLHHLEPEQRFLPLWHGVVRVSKNLYETSPHWDRRPLATDQVAPDALRRWLRHWVSVRHRDGAERCLLTALANNAPTGEVADLLLVAATDRIYGDTGHIVDFINKAMEMVSLIGWEHAAEVLPTLMNRLVCSRGGEESGDWRQPVDLVLMLRQLDDELPALMEQGRQKEAPDADARDLLALTDVLLGDDPAQIMAELKRVIAKGASPAELARLLAYAAALRVCRFGSANEFSDWISVLHTFSYCNAVHQLFKRIGGDLSATPDGASSPSQQAPSADAMRALFHAAMRVYLDRFLNVPPATMPQERELSQLPTDADALLSRFLDTLDRQAQVDLAARIVARYLSLKHPAAPLIQTLVRAVMREDAEFHTYQMLEAAVRQYEEWRGTEQGDHVLIAAARYIAAHAPTQREGLQTAEIVQRLQRGDSVHEGNCPSA